MIKKVFFAAVAFAAISTKMNAQTIFLEEDFEDTASWTDDTKWRVIGGGDLDLDWEFYEPGEFSDAGFPTHVAGSASFYMDDETLVPYEVNNSLWSPIFVLPEAGSHATLTFDAGAYFEEEGGELELIVGAFVEVETGIGSEPVSLYTGSFSASTTEAQRVEVDLSSYANENEIFLVFIHTGSTASGYLLIDNVKVTNEPASTESYDKLGLNVFPNPVSDVMNITSPEANIQAVTITDLNGRTVKSINFNNVAETTVDASDLASGVYLMNITANGTVATHKIVKK